MQHLKESLIDDQKLLTALKQICFTSKDLRAGWIGAGMPKTYRPEFKALAKWATEHWRMYETFLSEIKKTDGTVFDVGCGIGHATINLATIFPSANIIAVDNDDESINFAKKYNSCKNVTYQAIDFFRFSQDIKFDYIFALEIFEHLPSELHDLFIEKCLSLLSTNGKLFLTTPNALDEHDATYGHIGMLNRRRAKEFYLHYKDNILSESFIDNRQLLTGANDEIITNAPFETYQKDTEQKSHFRLVMQATPATIILSNEWNKTFLAISKKLQRRHQKVRLINASKTVINGGKTLIYRFASLLPKPIRNVLKNMLTRLQGHRNGDQWKAISLPLNNQVEPPANWHEDFIVHLASILRPKTYVELGLYHSEVFNRIIPFAENLYGVDMEATCEPFMKKIPGKTNFFLGATDAFVQVVKEKHLEIDLLFIDANHSKESVLADFTNYFPFVKDQGVILLHDAYPKNLQYTDPGYCGDGYRSIAELSRHTDAYEMVTIPHHPGVAICRKRSKHLPWL